MGRPQLPLSCHGSWRGGQGFGVQQPQSLAGSPWDQVVSANPQPARPQPHGVREGGGAGLMERGTTCPALVHSGCWTIPHIHRLHRHTLTTRCPACSGGWAVLVLAQGSQSERFRCGSDRTALRTEPSRDSSAQKQSQQSVNSQRLLHPGRVASPPPPSFAPHQPHEAVVWPPRLSTASAGAPPDLEGSLHATRLSPSTSPGLSPPLLCPLGPLLPTFPPSRCPGNHRAWQLFNRRLLGWPVRPHTVRALHGGQVSVSGLLTAMPPAPGTEPGSATPGECVLDECKCLE